MDCWRRAAGISRTERKTNDTIRKSIGITRTHRITDNKNKEQVVNLVWTWTKSKLATKGKKETRQRVGKKVSTEN